MVPWESRIYPDVSIDITTSTFYLHIYLLLFKDTIWIHFLRKQHCDILNIHHVLFDVLVTLEEAEIGRLHAVKINTNSLWVLVSFQGLYEQES